MKITNVVDIFKDYEKFLNQNITINWWIRSVRDSKTFGFIELNDWSYLKNIQVVFENNLSNFDDICKFTTGSSISVEWVLVASQWAKQLFEMKATKITLVGDCPTDYPLQKSDIVSNIFVKLHILELDQILFLQCLELEVYYLLLKQ